MKMYLWIYWNRLKICLRFKTIQYFYCMNKEAYLHQKFMDRHYNTISSITCDMCVGTGGVWRNADKSGWYYKVKRIFRKCKWFMYEKYTVRFRHVRYRKKHPKSEFSDLSSHLNAIYDLYTNRFAQVYRCLYCGGIGKRYRYVSTIDGKYKFACNAPVK